MVLLTAVQNERQPRNSAQVRQDQLDSEMDTGFGSSVVTVSATHPAFLPNQNHRFMAGIITAETSSKVNQSGQLEEQGTRSLNLIFILAYCGANSFWYFFS